MWVKGVFKFLQRSFVFISGTDRLFRGNVDIALFPSSDPFFSQNDVASSVVGLAWERDVDCLKLEKNCAKDNGLDEEGTLPGEWPFSEHNEPRLQIIKQAITMSLCKRNIIQSRLQKGLDIDYLSDASFIPVSGIDKRSFVVALYDSEYDYLLLTPQSKNIVDHSTRRLSFSAIIDLWMIIHHNQFCCKPPPGVIDVLKGTCGLQDQVGGSDALEEAQRSCYWTYFSRDLGGPRRQKTKELFRSGSECPEVVEA